MKKFLTVFLLVLTVAFRAEAYELPPDVRVNGNFLEPIAFIDEETTYVPVRFVSEALGYEVLWEDGRVIIGKTLIVDDFLIVEDRAFVPLRFVAESLGAEVSWDSELHIADVKTYESEGDDSLYWLSRIISAESSGEPLAGQIAVGNVVVNRVLSKDYPDTVKGVVFDSKGGVQFTPVSNGAIYKKPARSSVYAAKLVMRGESVAGKCLFFFNPSISTSSWISANRTFYVSIQNHDFYL